MERRKSKDYRPSMMETLRSRIIGGSMSNLAAMNTLDRRNTYSAIISGGTMTGKGSMSTVQRKILANKNRLGQIDDDFKVSEIEDGKRTVSSLKGIRRDSEVLYGGTIENINYQRRGRLDGIFNEAEYIDKAPPPPSGGLTRSLSQPDFMQELQRNGDANLHQEPPSIFVRPGMGSIVIRKSITNTFGGFYANNAQEGSSIGSGESYGVRQTTDDELSDSTSSDEDDPNGPLERFLTAFGLGEYLSKIRRTENRPRYACNTNRKRFEKPKLAARALQEARKCHP
ncbi:hypothetical protein NQ317_017610 [Molorchus minor]|uniref:Uncharacterized protein n=1 Tax=Molorchus minor TaxID=1323400 RepID=A0ABQ9J009_9CUCU|nr:hypothetical protein NQ317_017610 [Molorchus minor]